MNYLTPLYFDIEDMYKKIGFSGDTIVKRYKDYYRDIELKTKSLITLTKLDSKYLPNLGPTYYVFYMAFHGIPPSINKLYKTVRNSGKMYMTHDGKRWKRQLTKMFTENLHLQDFPILKTKRRTFLRMYIWLQTVTFRFPDPNNLLKLLIDSAEGVLYENDKYVLPLMMDLQPGKEEDRTFILCAYPREAKE